jgi:hypothetical protein
MPVIIVSLFYYVAAIITPFYLGNPSVSTISVMGMADVLAVIMISFGHRLSGHPHQ